jgi:hypothetical protein
VAEAVSSIDSIGSIGSSHISSICSSSGKQQQKQQQQRQQQWKLQWHHLRQQQWQRQRQRLPNGQGSQARPDGGRRGAWVLPLWLGLCHGLVFAIAHCNYVGRRRRWW